MRHAIIPTLLVLAGVAGAAEPTPLQEFGNSMGDQFNAMAKAQDAARGAAREKAYAEAAKQGITGTGSPVANSYRDAAIGQVVAAHMAAEAAFATGPLSGSAQAAQFLGAAVASTGSEVAAMAQATRPLFVAEMSGTFAREWQGTSALCTIDWGSVRLPVIAVGVAAERLAIDDEPVTGAVEGVIRVGLPIPIPNTSLAVGPAFSGRAGVTVDGDLVVGLDLFAHAEYAVGAGIGITADVGAGQRATEHAASDIQPVGSVGLAFVF